MVEEYEPVTSHVVGYSSGHLGYDPAVHILPFDHNQRRLVTHRDTISRACKGVKGTLVQTETLSARAYPHLRSRGDGTGHD